MESNFVIDETKKEMLVELVKSGKNTLLTGPTGCGKTTLAVEIAKELDMNPVVINCGSTQDARSSLIGYFTLKDGDTVFQEADFLKAIQEVAKGSNAQITGTLRAINLMHQLHQKAIQDKELKAILPLSDNEITWFNTAFSQESKFRKENVGQNYIKEFPERLQPYVVQRQDKADKK